MKHLKLFTTESDLLNNQKIFTALPSVSLETETNKISMYNPSENEVVLYFETTTPQDGSHDVDLVLWDGSLFNPGPNAHVFYDGKDLSNTIDWELVSSTNITITVDATKRDIHQVIVKGDGVFINGGFLYGSHAVAIDYPQNTGTSYLGVFGNCPNLTSIRLMNELPSSIEIDKFPEYSANEGVLYYNSKYEDNYSQILDNLYDGWTAVPITE